MKPRLYTKYENDVRPALIKSRSYKNVHQVPRIEKIVVKHEPGGVAQALGPSSDEFPHDLR